ncbi:hypothetical protein FQV26_10140 [Planococcus sp. CPCC 101016]|uniref:hypothetical protein n=1 Tax=Planococcus sp. CPCC 101016 TaxID=2599617 RepID=UPI0011B8558E|nr:hypothetical protein [Planococcus sp. CPCC 101016]TWT08144.1 hypothetical protein FQV26_10140 [Planococcus sp. CPCC 101016]
MTQRAGRWSLDNQKSGSARVALTGIRQIGEAAFFAAQSSWLMTQRAGRWSLDNQKSGSARVDSTGWFFWSYMQKQKKTAGALWLLLSFAFGLNYEAQAHH